jgi:serine/threonine protein kinase
MTVDNTTARSKNESTTGSPLCGFVSNGIRLDAIIKTDETGMTYSATQVASGRQLHVWIADARFANDETFCERFRRESDLLMNLRHLNVTCCLEHWNCTGPQQEPLLALVSEAISGLTLAALRQQERIRVRDVLVICQQAAEGLAAAHQFGIVHGDLTGGSLIISEGGLTKVNGFALGRGDYCIAENERRIIASPETMAPEVCRGQAPNSYSDIYSLGAVLYEAIMGEVPFPAANALESLHLQNTALIPSMSEQLPGSESIDILVKRMLAKDFNDRPATIAIVAKELLVLIDKTPGTLRCLLPNSQQPKSLTALVKKSMQAELKQVATIKNESDSVIPPRLRDVTPRQAKSQTSSGTGETTTISRSSIEYFTNPELFKPTGTTPALGNPVIGVSLPKTESFPNVKPSTNRIIKEQQSTLIVSKESLVAPTEQRVNNLPVKNQQEFPHKDIVLTKVPSVSIAPSEFYSWLVKGVSAVILVGIMLWYLMPHGMDSNKKEGEIPMPSTESAPSKNALSLDHVNFDNKIAEIEKLSAVDPQQALAFAALIRQQYPRDDLTRLPAPLRLMVDGPTWESVEIKYDGEMLPRPQNSVICRWANKTITVSISAPGYLPVEATVSPNVSVAEQVQIFHLPNKPQWQLSPFAPTWITFFPHPAGVALASDQKIVVIDSNNGQEIQRLDKGLFPELPAARIGWSLVTSSSERRLFSTMTGICLSLNETKDISATVVHRGEHSVSALVQAPLVFRLNEVGTFTIERNSGSYFLCADASNRRLWTKDLASLLPPTLAAVRDVLLLCLDNAFLVVDHESMVVQELQLPSNRTGAAVWIESGYSLAVPTRNGVLRLFVRENGQWAVDSRPLANGNIVALSCDKDDMVVVSDDAVQVLNRSENEFRAGWRQMIPTPGQLKYFGIHQGQLFLADSMGSIFILKRNDGSLINQIRLRSPALAPPYCQGDVIITAETNGLVCGFSQR